MLGRFLFFVSVVIIIPPRNVFTRIIFCSTQTKSFLLTIHRCSSHALDGGFWCATFQERVRLVRIIIHQRLGPPPASPAARPLEPHQISRNEFT